jgi:aminopeptidase YwaD
MFSKSIPVFSVLLFVLIMYSCAETKKDDNVKVEEVTNEIVDSTINTGEEIRYSVSLGIMPDMNYEGEGMLIGLVNKEAVGEIAGLIKGDVLVDMDGYKIVNLFTYTKALSQYKEGDAAKITIKREDQLMVLEAQF